MKEMLLDRQYRDAGTRQRRKTDLLLNRFCSKDDEPELNPSVHNENNPVFEEWSEFVHPQPPPEEGIDENSQGSDQEL